MKRGIRLPAEAFPYIGNKGYSRICSCAIIYDYVLVMLKPKYIPINEVH